MMLGAILLAGCNESGTRRIRPFENLLFERKGGGDLGFTMWPTTSSNTFQIVVTHIAFRDTMVQLTLSRSDVNATTLDALTRTLNGQEQIVGDYKPNLLPTGTWVSLYVMKGTDRYEITNVGLRNVLLNVEQIVRDNLGTP